MMLIIWRLEHNLRLIRRRMDARNPFFILTLIKERRRRRRRKEKERKKVRKMS